MDTLPDRSVTHVCKLYCHLCMEVQQLGIQAAIRAGIEYIVNLNNTPLDISTDFKGTISFEDKERNKVFKDTKSASSFLKEWGCN
ncbi:hypothetical protein BH18THE2_BH18THE2_21670 [soil metagenome]